MTNDKSVQRSKTQQLFRYLVSENGGQAEVGNLEDVVFGQEEVFRLDVPVSDSTVMKEVLKMKMGLFYNSGFNFQHCLKASVLVSNLVPHN